MNSVEPAKTSVQKVFIPSDLQKALLNGSLLQTDKQLYVEQLHLSIDGQFKLDAFEQTWQWLIRRHSALRSAFVWENQSDIWQVILDQVQLRVERIQLAPNTKIPIEKQLQQFIEEDGQRGFKLDVAPLARVTVLEENIQRRHVVITMHHAIMDGWSFTLLTGEMAFGYMAYLDGRQPELPPPAGFEAYIDWIQQQDFKSAKQFWTQALSKIDSGTVFPRSLAATEPPDAPYCYLTDSFNKEEGARLQSFCKSAHITSNILVSAAWLILLHVYCGRSNVTFGSAYSIRPLDLPDSQTIVGPLINTIPINATIDRSISLRAFLLSLRSDMVDYQAHSALPLTQILGRLPDHVATGSDNPLFESLLISDNFAHATDNDSQNESAMRVTNHETPERVAYPAVVKCDLQNIRLSYHVDRLQPGIVQDMVYYLKNLLLYIADRPETTIAEAIGHLSRLHPTLAGHTKPGHDTLCQQIHHHAIHSPDTVAIRDAYGEISYAELSQQIRVMAKNLQAHPSQIIGVALPRDVSGIASMLAIMECRACYLPLDASYPPERLRFIIKDAAPSTIIVGDSQTLDDLQLTSSVRTVTYDALRTSPAGSQPPDSEAMRQISDDKLAYIIYTSGSTGQPKGSINTYRSVHAIMNLCGRLMDKPTERVLQFASLNFDVSLLETAMAAISGSTLVILPDTVKTSVKLVQNVIREHAISCACLPPVVAATLTPDMVPTLRTLMTVGEPCPPLVARLWGETRRFFNLYGPTEAAIITLINAVHETGHNTAIGTPVDNVDIALRDQDGLVVPRGVPGELWLHGASVSGGYLNRPDANDRAYRYGGYMTGDDCYIGTDQLVHFIGRKDHQVQVRGYRVELGEIEQMLCQILKAQEAIVLACNDPDRGISLHAFIRGLPATQQYDAQLRSILKKHLPAHMLPSSIQFVTQWPLNRNLKIDRIELQSMIASTTQEIAFEPCTTETEHALATLYAEQFKIPVADVGRHFDFFANRGQSLLAAAVTLKLRRTLARPDIPLDIIYQFPRLGQLASHLDGAQGDASLKKTAGHNHA